jgi:hypothetical protein
MDIGQNQLAAGDIVSETFRGWFANFGQVFVVSFVFTVPIFILNAIILSGLPEVPDDIDDFDFGNFLTRSLGGTFISILLSIVLTAALSYTFIKIFRGEPVLPAEAAQAVLANIGPILIFAIVSAILTALGFILLVIPGLMAIIALSMGTPAILNEQIDGTTAAARSFQLISGNWGVAIGVVLIGFAINIVVSLVLGGLAAPGALSYPDFSNFGLARSLVQMAASAVVAPLVPGLATALYFDLKGRKEGFPSIW